MTVKLYSSSIQAKPLLMQVGAKLLKTHWVLGTIGKMSLKSFSAT